MPTGLLFISKISLKNNLTLKLNVFVEIVVLSSTHFHLFLLLLELPLDIHVPTPLSRMVGPSGSIDTLLMLVCLF